MAPLNDWWEEWRDPSPEPRTWRTDAKEIAEGLITMAAIIITLLALVLVAGAAQS